MKIPIERLKTIVVHPFFFALVIIVAAVAQIRQLVLPEEVLPSVVILELLTATVFLIASLALRDWAKGGIFCSLFLGLFFAYRLVTCAIDYAGESIFGKPPTGLVDLIIYLILIAAVLASAMKTKWNFGKYAFELDHQRFSTGLNILSVLLFVINSATLAVSEMQDSELINKYVTQFKTALDGTKLDTAKGKPDIYYLIVDGFANRKTMQDMFNCREEKLYKFLSEKGFYVVADAASNYDRTELSISSSLNMQFINSIPDKLGRDYAGLTVFDRMIQDNAVVKTLRSVGYKFISVSSGGGPTDCIYQADRNIRALPMNNFVTALMLLTPMFTTEKYVPLLRDLLVALRLCPDQGIGELASIPGPKFVLIHTLLAHSPCIFDEHGNRLPLPEGHYMINWGTPAELSGQWKYTQTKVIEWTDQLLRQSDGKAIIIVQSDHGSGIAMPDPNDWYNERMRILNAYYLPGMKNEGLYPTITPVNSFRVVFNDYFGSKLPMLPDEVWCAPDFARPFYWSNVRDKLKFDSSGSR